jgi:excisionase family DNA binding protein
MTLDAGTVPERLLYAVDEAAALLGMRSAKLRELTTRGKIRSVKIDGMRRWRADDLREFVDQLRETS